MSHAPLLPVAGLAPGRVTLAQPPTRDVVVTHREDGSCVLTLRDPWRAVGQFVVLAPLTLLVGMFALATGIGAGLGLMHGPAGVSMFAVVLAASLGWATFAALRRLYTLLRRGWRVTVLLRSTAFDVTGGVPDQGFASTYSFPRRHGERVVLERAGRHWRVIIRLPKAKPFVVAHVDEAVGRYLRDTLNSYAAMDRRAG